MKIQKIFCTFVVALSLFAVPSMAQVVLLEEDFEGLPLGSFIDENLTDPGTLDPSQVWTNVPPEGWEIEDVTPLGGVEDWRTWSFANKNAWVFVAGDQRRSDFTKGVGTVAIVDPDEWDDKAHDPGTFNSFMRTPPISIAGAPENSVVVQFDSSWRPEDNQAAALTVSYDGGASQDVFFWTSFPGDPFFKDDNSSNETLIFQLENPAGTSEMVLSFEMFEAGNDWWWAIDNIQVTSEGQTLFTEDFEGLDLGPFVDENLPENISSINSDAIWTSTPPENWTQEFIAPEGGVTEWMGWSFVINQAWAIVADDQRRSEFKKGTGTIAVADPDEWDDIGSPGSAGTYNAFLNTSPISVADAAPNSVEITFDSSWRPEDLQKARLSAIYDGGDPVEILVWTSDAGAPDFKDDNSTNETLTFNLQNPAGASELVISFEVFDAGNDWWWAIDNIRVVDTSREPQIEPLTLPVFEDFEGLRLRAFVDETTGGDGTDWTKTPPVGWSVDDSGVPVGGVTEWRGWSFADLGAWATAAEDQQRSQFTNASGTVAVADPDEWDDSSHDPGTFNTALSTPPVLLNGAAANSVVLSFDSSWRPEDDQKVRVEVSFDGGASVELFRWTSNAADTTFKPDAVNERLEIPVGNPAGASNMVVSWIMFEAGNDWWWAIDNVSINQPGTSVNDWQIFE